MPLEAGVSSKACITNVTCERTLVPMCPLVHLQTIRLEESLAAVGAPEGGAAQHPLMCLHMHLQQRLGAELLGAFCAGVGLFQMGIRVLGQRVRVLEPLGALRTLEPESGVSGVSDHVCPECHPTGDGLVAYPTLSYTGRVCSLPMILQAPLCTEDFITILTREHFAINTCFLRHLFRVHPLNNTSLFPLKPPLFLHFGYFYPPYVCETECMPIVVDYEALRMFEEE